MLRGQVRRCWPSGCFQRDAGSGSCWALKNWYSRLQSQLLTVPIHVRVWFARCLGELDSGARLGYISPHTHEWIPKLCSYISVSRMSSSKQIAATVIILDECGVFGRKRKNRKRREMWAKKWLLDRDRYTHLNLLNFIRNDSPEEYLGLPWTKACRSTTLLACRHHRRTNHFSYYPELGAVLP